MQKKTSPHMTFLDFLERIWVPIIVALIGACAVVIVAILPDGNEVITPSPRAEFAYQVRVEEKDTGKPIPKAEVRIEVGGKAPLDEITDAGGYARIIIDSSYVGQPGKLIVKATGYEECEKIIDLKKDALPDVVVLDPAP